MLDLFKPSVTIERFHPAFRTIFNQATDLDKNVLNQWAEGFVDRDGKFIKEFQTTFDSSFWELYLYAAFKELGMNCDFQKSRPDFCIIAPRPFVVEATVSLNAQGSPSVTETDPLALPPDFNEFNRQAIIRLSNSLHAKYQKYLSSYRQLPHVAGKPFVVAIAPFDRPHFQLQAQRPVEALLYRAYVDEMKYLSQHPDRSVPLLAEDMPFVVKDNGERLPMGVFCDDSMSGVSAVIQSTAATWSKVRAMSRDPDVMIEAIYENRQEGGQDVFIGPNSRYTESILDGLRVYHNPFATNPLEDSIFARREIFQATSRRPVSLTMMNESRHLLVNRRATTLPAGTMAEVLRDMAPNQSFWRHL